MSKSTFTSTSISKLRISLNERFDEYFSVHNKSRKADSVMIMKISIAFLWWIGSYVILFAFDYSYVVFLFLYTFHALSQTLLTLGIGHDANHQAISNSKYVNDIFSYTFDACGVSSFFWRVIHNQGHHNHLNIQGEDISLATGKLLRLSPFNKRLQIHKYQHLYAWILYSLYTLDYVVARDLRWLISKKLPMRDKVNLRAKDIAILLFWKIFYFTYVLVIPCVFLEFSFWQILLAFVGTHLILGISFLLIFQSGHLLEDASFPKSKNRFSSHEEHVLTETADFSVNNRLIGWYFGGMNTHAVHHIYPNICHTHYRHLTRILMTTAKEYGLIYRQNTSLKDALTSHYKHLKKMGSID